MPSLLSHISWEITHEEYNLRNPSLLKKPRLFGLYARQQNNLFGGNARATCYNLHQTLGSLS